MKCAVYTMKILFVCPLSICPPNWITNLFPLTSFLVKMSFPSGPRLIKRYTQLGCRNWWSYLQEMHSLVWARTQLSAHRRISDNNCTVHCASRNKMFEFWSLCKCGPIFKIILLAMSKEMLYVTATEITISPYSLLYSTLAKFDVQNFHRTFYAYCHYYLMYLDKFNKTTLK